LVNPVLDNHFVADLNILPRKVWSVNIFFLFSSIFLITFFVDIQDKVL
jgi:hypothetical protein